MQYILAPFYALSHDNALAETNNKLFHFVKPPSDTQLWYGIFERFELDSVGLGETT